MKILPELGPDRWIDGQIQAPDVVEQSMMELDGVLLDSFFSLAHQKKLNKADQASAL